MALETKIASPTANSFVTLAEANTRAASLSYDTSAWDALTEASKEECLKLSAAAMGKLPLRGRRVNRRVSKTRLTTWSNWSDGYEEQALCFPRTSQFTWTVIPDEVKECQIDIAVTIIAPLFPQTGDSGGDDPDEQTIKRMSIGPLSVTFNDPAKRPSAEYILGDTKLLTSSVVSLKLQRYLTAVRGLRVDTAEEIEEDALSDRITTTTTTTTTSTTTTTTA